VHTATGTTTTTTDKTATTDSDTTTGRTVKELPTKHQVLPDIVDGTSRVTLKA
jgi:hypothetical protein